MVRQPFFSIIVPTYNQAQFLDAALDSIIAQTDSDWEAIVVNDGSTDATADVLEAYALKDPRIRKFHKPNGGVASALNEGRKQAQGQWICWLSSDDMFDPHKLEIHRQWIDRYPDCQFFFTYFRLLRESTGEITDHDLWGPLPEPEFQIVTLFYRNYISGISICINRAAWDQVGMMDESLRYGQDFDMWLRLLAVYPGRFIPQWTCVNRNHASQGSEVFPQACYFDTAKAAIRFLNNHRFEELFPLLDLSDVETALKALQKTFEIAAEPSAFLYSLGPHPALLFRMMEWVWDTKIKREPSFQRKLEECIQQKISQILQQQDNTDFGRFWKAAAVTAQLLHPRLEYQPISPATVGEMYYYANQSAGSAFLEPLEEYLRRYNNLQVTPSSTLLSDEKIVMLLPFELSWSDKPRHPIVAQSLKLARNLCRKGYKVLFIGRSKQSIDFVDGILFWGAEEQNILEKMVVSLGLVDILVNISRDDGSKVKATRKIVYELPENERDEFINEQELIKLIEAAPIQKDYSRILGSRAEKFLKRLSKGLIRMKQYSFNMLRRIMSLLRA